MKNSEKNIPSIKTVCGIGLNGNEFDMIER